MNRSNQPRSLIAYSSSVCTFDRTYLTNPCYTLFTFYIISLQILVHWSTNMNGNTHLASLHFCMAGIKNSCNSDSDRENEKEHEVDSDGSAT